MRMSLSCHAHIVTRWEPHMGNTFTIHNFSLHSHQSVNICKNLEFPMEKNFYPLDITL